MWGTVPPMTTRNESPPLPRAPRTSDSIAKMLRSRVETTTVGLTSGVSWVIGAEKAEGEALIRPKTLSVTMTWLHAGDRLRWRRSGNSGGFTSAIRSQRPASVNISGLPWFLGDEVLRLWVVADQRRSGLLGLVLEGGLLTHLDAESIGTQQPSHLLVVLQVGTCRIAPRVTATPVLLSDQPDQVRPVLVDEAPLLAGAVVR